ncbi:MAG: MBOAT family O-acyltransferase [Nannocystaceae bacterium]
MLFASLDFLLFIVPVLAAYWALANHPRARALLLISASYFFYVASSKSSVDGGLPASWYYVGLLLFSTVLNYVGAARIQRQDHNLESDDLTIRRRAAHVRNGWLTATLVGNLGLLAYFKYTNFLIEAFTDIAQVMGVDLMATKWVAVLPIGISFYTFQSLSYTIDVWRRTLTGEPSFRKFALFVGFFPQLVAGPIVRANQFLPQLHHRPRLDQRRVGEALFRISKGMLKKVVFGDWIPVMFSDMVFANPESYTSLEHLLALYAFTLQIYGDFSGYSDIAIGVAKLMGFDLPENFDRPYQARSVGEFWRRWHMTLSTWLRDYLFFPLGGSRKGTLRTYFNLWLTMFLVGMWHRASWNFIIYSNIHGLAMLLNRWKRQRRQGKARAAGTGRGIRYVAMLGVSGIGLASYALGMCLLELPPNSAMVLAAFAVLSTLAATWVPENDRPWSVVAHVLMMFHFTVLSRIFFLASDLDAARSIMAKLLAWDGHGVRPGLFRVDSWHGVAEGVVGSAMPEFVGGAMRWVADQGVLLVMIVGLGYHFTPRVWVDVLLRDRIARLPGPVLGIMLVLVGALLVDLLDGPRANIYFAF